MLNGSGKTGQASEIAAYLEYRGINASAPTQRPPAAPAATKIVVYNGAENDDPATVALLEAVFGVHATTVNDPTARVDIVITTSKSTPNLVRTRRPLTTGSTALPWAASLAARAAGSSASGLLGHPVFEVAPGHEPGLGVERRQVAEDEADHRQEQPLETRHQRSAIAPLGRPWRADPLLDVA